MLSGIALLWLFGLTEQGISKFEGVVLAAIYIGYLFYLSREEKTMEKIRVGKDKKYLFADMFGAFGGFALLIFCANFININGRTLPHFYGGICRLHDGILQPCSKLNHAGIPGSVEGKIPAQGH